MRGVVAMLKGAIPASLLIVLAASAPVSSEARFRCDGGRRPQAYGGPWREGYWFHGAYLDRMGWWWIVGPNWYFYSAPIYPYPPANPQPVAIMAANAPPPAPLPAGLAASASATPLSTAPSAPNKGPRLAFSFIFAKKRMPTIRTSLPARMDGLPRRSGRLRQPRRQRPLGPFDRSPVRARNLFWRTEYRESIRTYPSRSRLELVGRKPSSLAAGSID